MLFKTLTFSVSGLGVLLALALPTRLAAQEAAGAFYKGKTVTIVTSTGPGGVYDLVARLAARFMPKHLPGSPNMVVQNMPGGGNVLASNYMYDIAPKDGTVIAVVNNAVPLNQVLDGRGVRFDSRKFNWIGSTGGRNEAVFILRSAGVNSVAELKAKEIVLGGTAPGSSIVIYPAAMNNVLGTKFKIVTGYKSSTEVFLAMERGEIMARSGSLASIYAGFPKWIEDKKIVFVAQIGPKRDKDLSDVPLLTELATTDEQRRVLALISSPATLGQPYLAPPGLPEDRVAGLRKAFMMTMEDSEFQAAAAKAQVDLSPISGEEIAAIVAEVVGASPEIIAKARAAVLSDSSK